MSAYYNENDPYAAQWLRNLISRGLIAPGEDAPEIVAGRWVGGEQPSLEGKIVVVDVFATWCEPCARATPKLVEIYDDRTFRFCFTNRQMADIAQALRTL